MVTLQDIEQAHRRISEHVLDTPFLLSRTLSDIASCKLRLKFENLQFTASFKERGAANRLMTLPRKVAQRGVIAVSAGNHAQGLAYHCQRLGIAATIVMPHFTPFVKVENTQRFGATVVLNGDSFAQARDAMQELAQEKNLTIVHPYDDDMIIAGQGTIGIEMLRDAPDLDAIVIAVGGGGLIGGIATAARAIKPDIDIVGVQTSQYPGAYQDWARANDVTTEAMPAGGPTLAEGIAVQSPGPQTRPLIESLVDHMILVEEADIEQAILLLLDIEKTVVEGAGAAGLAGVLKEPARFHGKNVGLVLCGGNIDMLTLSDVAQRQLARADKLVRLSVGAPDSPGSLATIARIIGEQGANIEEVSHQRAFADMPVRFVRIDLVLSTRGTDHLTRVVRALADDGFSRLS